MDEKNLVEALEEGRIVKVPEAYAISEGLTIIKKPKAPAEVSKIKEQEKKLKDYSKRHSNWKDKQVISELIDNFHWQIRVQRKNHGWTRKQLASMLNEDEESVRLIESGVLPSKDFVLINKIQKLLGINLRKDGKNMDKPLSEMLARQRKEEEKETMKKKLLGSDIEILDEEI